MMRRRRLTGDGMGCSLSVVISGHKLLNSCWQALCVAPLSYTLATWQQLVSVHTVLLLIARVPRHASYSLNFLCAIQYRQSVSWSQIHAQIICDRPIITAVDDDCWEFMGTVKVAWANVSGDGRGWGTVTPSGCQGWALKTANIIARPNYRLEVLQYMLSQKPNFFKSLTE